MSDFLSSCRFTNLAAVAVLAAACGAAGAAPGGDPLGKDWSRYQGILDREPFGKAPQPGDSGAAGVGETAAAEPEPVGPGLAETVRLSVVSLFGGTPAAGFSDTTTGKSYYLFEGQSVDEFTLLSVDAQGGSVKLRKAQQEATLTLGSAAEAVASAPPAAGSVGVTAPSSSAGSGTGASAEPLSYAERQRRRVAEARARMEEARKRAEEARKSQEADVARLTGEALQRHLRELNLQMIRSGQGTSLPIELTPQEVAQLAAEGFDVSLPPGTPPPEAPEDAEPLRIRRGGSTLPEAE